MFCLLQFNSTIKRRNDVFAILEKNDKLLNFRIHEKGHKIGYTFCIQHKTFCYNGSPLRISVLCVKIIEYGISTKVIETALLN